MSNKVAFGRCEKWHKLEFVKSAKIRKKYEGANGLAIGKYWQMMMCLCGADIVPCVALVVVCPFVPWVCRLGLVGGSVGLCARLCAFGGCAFPLGLARSCGCGLIFSLVAVFWLFGGVGVRLSR